MQPRTEYMCLVLDTLVSWLFSYQTHFKNAVAPPTLRFAKVYLF